MKRAISLILSLILLTGLTANYAYAAENANTSGMVINKTATANADGSYTVMLEAYATGSKVTTSTKIDVPTDIILVLDQSSSMDDTFSSVTEESWRSYGTRENSENYADRMNRTSGNGNLYHKLDENTYVGVSVVRTEGEPVPTYVLYDSQRNRDIWSLSERNTTLYTKVGEEYKEVSISRSESNNGGYIYTYSYTNNGETFSPQSTGRNGTPPFDIYILTEVTEYIYEYSYTVGDQNTVIGESNGENTVFSTEFFEKVTTTTNYSALDALKSAVTTFVNNVNEKAKGEDGQYNTPDDINHRIAVVGFASGSYVGSNGYYQYENTEVFIGANQYNLNTNASNYYGSAFQDMNTEAGYNNVIASKNALDARGATCVNLGIQMANGIFAEYSIPEGTQRNRVVIVFTDGKPSSWADYDSSVANAGITEAGSTKSDYGATVYTVGIFSGADATDAGSASGNDTQKSNWFMQSVSSNNGTPQSPSYYLSAADAASLNNIFEQISNNIESSSTSVTLDEETIVKDIIAPQFTLPAGATAADITLETYACTGEDEYGNYTWSKNDDVMGAAATVNGDQVNVTGFDFAENYVAEANDEYRGHKLVIKFTVSPKAGFLGGNDVYTNTSAGIYEDSNATAPVLEFNRPQVNVPIKEVKVTAPDKNVYLLADLTADQIKSGATAACGSATLKLSEENFGLEAWQYEFVTITVTYTDAAGNAVSDLADLKADTTYSVEVVITPKVTDPTSNQGDKAEEKNDDDEGNINVFKPELTFKDSVENYLADVVDGTDITSVADYHEEKNYVSDSEAWVHTAANGNKTTVVFSTDASGATVTTPTMLGTKPTITLDYDTSTAAITEEGIVKSTVDIPVNVTVNLDGTPIADSYVTFEHVDCTSSDVTCTFDASKCEFIVHVINVVGDLTITKIVKDSTFTSGTKEFTFTIEPQEGQTIADSKKSVTITVTADANANSESNSVTVEDLIVGDYKITETTVEGYTTTYDSTNQVVEVTTDNDAAITVTNTAVGTIDVEVQKVWDDEDNRYGLRPADETGVAIELQANGVTATNSDDTDFDATITLTETADDWYYKWTDMDKFDADGVEIVYSVVETPVANYQEPVYSNGTNTAEKETKTLLVTNTIKRTELTIKKTWNEAAYYYANGDVESAMVSVTGNGVDYTVALTAGNGYSVTITNLPVGLTLNLAELTGWNWRYTTSGPDDITLVENASSNVATFNNSVTNESWLGGDNYTTNVFNAN